MTWMRPLAGEYMRLTLPTPKRKPFCRPVIVLGKHYVDVLEASKELKVTKAAIYKRIRQGRGADYA